MAANTRDSARPSAPTNGTNGFDVPKSQCGSATVYPGCVVLGTGAAHVGAAACAGAGAASRPATNATPRRILLIAASPGLVEEDGVVARPPLPILSRQRIVEVVTLILDRDG